MERRPELLSSVMLRQNPHNVHEWHKRVKLFAGNANKQILTYTEAVTTVDVHKVGDSGTVLSVTVLALFLPLKPRLQLLYACRLCFGKISLDQHFDRWALLDVQAIGKVYTLWTGFARFYERHGDLENARVIFDKATQVRACSEALSRFLQYSFMCTHGTPVNVTDVHVLQDLCRADLTALSCVA